MRKKYGVYLGLNGKNCKPKSVLTAVYWDVTQRSPKDRDVPKTVVKEARLRGAGGRVRFFINSFCLRWKVLDLTFVFKFRVPSFRIWCDFSPFHF